MKLTILVPCYNEAATVGQIIERLFAAPLPEGWAREIIVIDDGSNVATKEALARASQAYPALIVILREQNGGKGAALKDGMRRATGDYLIIQDADLEYNPDSFPALLAPIIRGEARVVFGSRQLSDNNVAGRFIYYWGGWAVNALFNLAFQTQLSDLSTCYKVFPRALVPELLIQPADDFVFDVVELSRIAVREPLVEVPIEYRARDAAHGKKLQMRHGVRIALRIFSLSPRTRVARFVIAGGIGAAVNLCILYTLTSMLGVWYLFSEIVAFLVAVSVSFGLQKLWAFRDRRNANAPQMFVFLTVNCANLALNALILYFLVEQLGLWYVYGQIIASLAIATESFYVYRGIFRGSAM